MARPARQTQKEEIMKCLNCKKSYCDNCLAMEGKTKVARRKLYKWDGEYHTVKELAAIKGVRYNIMINRMKHGLAFAMSEYRTRYQYDKARKEGKIK